MFSRHDLSDDHWDRIQPLLPGQAGGHGGVGDDTRLFANVIRYLSKTGIAWADLPTSAGKSNSLWQRYDRGCERGVWERMAAELRDDHTEGCSSIAVASAPTRPPPAREKKRTGAAAKRPRRWAAGAADSARNSTPRRTRRAIR